MKAKIRKEIAENEESTVWRDRRERLLNCVAQKKRDTLGNKWETKYAEFERCVEMPAVGTTLYHWKQSVEHRNLWFGC